MAKQRLNHSRYLDSYAETRRNNMEVERLHRLPTARQKHFWRGLCAMLREQGITPPPDPYDRIDMNNAIDGAIATLREKGVEIHCTGHEVTHTLYPANPTDTNSVARVRTVVEGFDKRTKKPMNWNGLTPRKETHDNC